MAVIDLNKIKEIKAKLKELPKQERVKTYSGPEALEALSKEIHALSRKGYSSKEIAGILKQEGLAASSAKIKKILAGEPAQGEPSEGESKGDDPPADPEPAFPVRTPPEIKRRPATPRQTSPENSRKEAQL